jgi:hypothetical protein
MNFVSGSHGSFDEDCGVNSGLAVVYRAATRFITSGFKFGGGGVGLRMMILDLLLPTRRRLRYAGAVKTGVEFCASSRQAIRDASLLHAGRPLLCSTWVCLR